MASGRYDHPAFLTPLSYNGRSAAASADATYISFPYAVRVTDLVATPNVKGTNAIAGVVISQDGTAKGTVALGTNNAGIMGTAANLGITVPANGTLSIVKGTDATAVIDWGFTYFLDPQATWNKPS